MRGPLPLPQSRGDSVTSSAESPDRRTPRFRMCWSLSDWLQNPSASPAMDLPVVLVTDPADMYTVLETLAGEKQGIGIHVIEGPNNGKPVVCLCCQSVVFAVESSLVRELDIGILFTFLCGLATSLVSLRQLEFREHFPSLNTFPNVRPVAVGHPTRTPPSGGSSLDPDSMATLFGLPCFQARQGLVFPRDLGIYSKIIAAQQRVVVVPKRQRTLAPDLSQPMPTLDARKSSTEEFFPLAILNNSQPLFVEDPVGDREEGEDTMDEKAKRYLEWFQ